MASTMQARVVVLPEPAWPVTSTRPFLQSFTVMISGGMWNSSGFGRPKRMTRTTAARVPRCRNRFTRNRPMPLREQEKSSSIRLPSTQ